MAVFLLVALLSLVCLSAASAPDCKELVKPFSPNGNSLLLGKWVFVMGSADPEFYHRALESLQSSWIDLSVVSDNQTVVLRWGDGIFNRCILGSSNVTISGDATTFHKNLSNHKGQLLQTCSDCLLWTDSFRNGDVTGRYLLQFTKTGKTDPIGIQMFKNQAACLNFPDKYHMYDGKAELCPDNNQ